MSRDVPVHRPPARKQLLDAPDPHALHAWAQAVFGLSIILGVLGVAGGVALVSQTSDIGTAFLPETTHPYASLGVGVIAAAVIQALVVCMLAQWAMLYARMTARRIAASYQ